MSDKEVIRFLLLNTIYTFNSKEKVITYEGRIENPNNENEDHKSHSRSSNSSLSESELDADFSDALRGLDDDSHTLHFILYNCRCQLDKLFD